MSVPGKLPLKWLVEIRPFTEDETDPGFLCMVAYSERDARRIERGANINLNHRDYYTRVVKPELADLPDCCANAPSPKP